MTDEPPANADDKPDQIVGWLQEQGYSATQVEAIMKRLREYDAQTLHESVFDSIEGGSFDIGKVIDEALGQEEA